MTKELSEAEAVQVAAFGLDKPEAEPWVVHVLGPDDVLPAAGMLDAVRQAHAINAASIEPGGYYGDATEDRPYMTYVWAVPKKESWIS
jgi:hypothetical protein